MNNESAFYTDFLRWHMDQFQGIHINEIKSFMNGNSYSQAIYLVTNCILRKEANYVYLYYRVEILILPT